MTSDTPTTAPETSALNVRVPIELKNALKAIAHEQHTDITTLVLHNLAEFVGRQQAARTARLQDSGYRQQCAHCGRIPPMSIVISKPDESRRVACIPFCSPPVDATGFPVTLGCSVAAYLADTGAEVDEVIGRVVSLSSDAYGKPVADIELPGRPFVFIQRTDLLRVIL